MKAIAIMNNKGGVGKTVTAINLADILANDYKQRVVLVDCDGQANLSGFFLPGEDMDSTTTADVLTGDCEQVWSDNLIPLRHNIQLLPSSSGLYDLDLQAIKDGASAPERLRGFVDAAREDGDTDWMIFDCPPGYTVSSVAALLATDEVLIPVLADKFSLDGVHAVAEQAGKLAAARPGLRVRALMTQVRTSDVVTEAEKVLEAMGVRACRTKIRRTDKVPESTLTLLPLRQYSPGSSAARDYRALAAELMEEVQGCRHLGGPRSEFMCRHQDAEKVFKQVCPRSYKMPGFIGFSRPGKIVPAIKTSPRWCPLRDRKEVQ